MKTLFEPAVAEEVKDRLGRLRSDSRRQWGKMSASQAVAHCAAAMECAVGDSRPPRQLAGRLFGRFARPMLVSPKPMSRNAPTAPGLRVTDERDLDIERARLVRLIDRFSRGGPARCTTHPHSFFGPLTPDEWATWMYKHLDHHLRQFEA